MTIPNTAKEIKVYLEGERKRNLQLVDYIADIFENHAKIVNVLSTVISNPAEEMIKAVQDYQETIYVKDINSYISPDQNAPNIKAQLESKNSPPFVTKRVVREVLQQTLGNKLDKLNHGTQFVKRVKVLQSKSGLETPCIIQFENQQTAREVSMMINEVNKTRITDKKTPLRFSKAKLRAPYSETNIESQRAQRIALAAKRAGLISSFQTDIQFSRRLHKLTPTLRIRPTGSLEYKLYTSSFQSDELIVREIEAIVKPNQEQIKLFKEQREMMNSTTPSTTSPTSVTTENTSPTQNTV